MTKLFNIKVTLFGLLISIFTDLSAQLRNAPDPTLESPHNTILVHLYYLQSDSYEPEIAAQTIAPGLDSARAVEVAIQIKQLFDGNGLFVRLNTLPDESAYVDTLTDKPYYTVFPAQLPEVYLERIDGKWYYSRETADLVPSLHKSLYPLGSDILVRILPRQADVKFLGITLWQLVGFLFIVIACLLVYVVIFWLSRRIIRTIIAQRESWQDIEAKEIRRVARFASLFVVLWVAKMMLPAVQLPIRAAEVAHKGLGVLGALAFLMLGMSLINIGTHHVSVLTNRTSSKMDDQLLPIIRRAAQIVVVLGAIIYVLELLDVNVTALVAGISIGGLALALAAQDTVKNVIGSAMIFADRPFQVGDYIQVAGHEGTVTEVGFRTTRIMTIDTAILSIPNGQLSSMSLTNLGVRENRLFNLSLGLVYGTPRRKLREYIDRLRALVRDNPRVKEEPVYIHLRELADFSINIMFRCYLMVPGYAEELQLKEEMLFDIIRLAEEVGVDFAFPTQTIVVDQND